MRRLGLAIVFIFLNLSIARSQEVIKKVVVDAETNRPLSGAHIYLADDFKTGTITNSNGRFILTNISKNDILEISHLSYAPFIGTINTIKSDTISLLKSSIVLDEILVNNLSGRSIMAKVIDSLYKNHFIEPVMYEVYVRILEYERDSSELHVLSEYLMNVYQNKKHNSKISVVKTRAKPFSGAGKKYFRDMRMIDATAIYTDNIFKYKDEVLKKKNLKHFEFEIVYDSTNTNNNLIVMNCTPIKEKASYYTVLLSINKRSYAVQKMTVYYSSTKDFKEIGFKEINNKWYLDYSIKTRVTSRFSQRKSGSEAIYDRLVIYNINELVEDNSENFKSVLNIIAEPIKLHIGDWSDNFWENYNYVPLPAWVQDKINDSGSH